MSINDSTDESTDSCDFKTEVRLKFDSFCRKSIEYVAHDVARTAARNTSREKLLSDDEMEEMISDYSLEEEGIAEELYVCGLPVTISNAELADILEKLSDREREIVILSMMYDFSPEEIGKKLDISAQTVISTKSKALKKIRERGRCEKIK